MGLLYRGKLCRDVIQWTEMFFFGFFSAATHLIKEGTCCFCGFDTYQADLTPIKFKRKKDKGKKVYGHACRLCLKEKGLKKKGDKFKSPIVSGYRFMYAKEAFKFNGGYYDPKDMGAKEK